MSIFSLRLKPCIRFSFFVFVCAMLFSVESIVLAFVVVLLHELGHVGACLFLGIKVLGIRAYPWGMSASVPLINDPLIQVAVSLAGPCTNFVLLLLCPLLERVFGSDISEIFALLNFANAFLNLIPALPLDGGVVLKSVLTSCFGFVRGFIYVIRITAFIGILIALFGVQMFIVTGYNMTYFTAGCFILANLSHERRLVMCLRKMVFTGEAKSKGKKKTMTADAKSHAVCLTGIISPTHVTVFKVVSEGKPIGEVSQEHLIECVIKNTMITLGECIEKSQNL